jgi:hypothetical protein
MRTPSSVHRAEWLFEVWAAGCGEPRSWPEISELEREIWYRVEEKSREYSESEED